MWWRIRITKFPSLFDLVTAIRRKWGLDLRAAIDLKDCAVNGSMMRDDIAVDVCLLIESLGGSCDLELAI